MIVTPVKGVGEHILTCPVAAVRQHARRVANLLNISASLVKVSDVLSVNVQIIGFKMV